MKSLFRNLPPILIVILVLLLFVLYKSSQYLNKQQSKEKARIEQYETPPTDQYDRGYRSDMGDTTASSAPASPAGDAGQAGHSTFKEEPVSPAAGAKETHPDDGKAAATASRAATSVAAEPKKAPAKEPKPAAPAKASKPVEKPSAKAAAKPAPAPKPKAAATKAAPDKGAAKEQFYVLAGSYSKKENAQEQVAKLRKMGYSNAKMVRFSSLQYISVCVNAYPTEAQAKTLAGQLKAKGISTVIRGKSGN